MWGGGQGPVLMGWGRSRDNEAGSLCIWLSGSPPPPASLVMGAQLLFLTVLKPLGRDVSAMNTQCPVGRMGRN